jgi:transposase-like protein
VLVQSRRDKKAAKRLFRKLLKKQGRAPRVLVTDKLKSYAAAKREIMPGVEHRQHKGLNNRPKTPINRIRVGRRASSASIQEQSAARTGASRACTKTAMTPSATP